MQQVFGVFLLALVGCTVAAGEDPLLFAATGFNHLQVYSFASTSAVNEIGYDLNVYSVTCNANKGHVYYSTNAGEVFRADFNGSNIEKVYQVSGLYYSLALAYDWAGDNLYITEYSEYEIAVCTAGGETCAAVPLPPGISRLTGLALDPTQGKMYYSSKASRTIYKANMDGSNATAIVSGSMDPGQLVIDFENSRLYWNDVDGMQVMSSDLNGQDLRVFQKLSYTPWGIALYGDRLYWSTHENQTVASCDKQDASDIQLPFTGESTIYGITIADLASQSEPTSSPCASQPCSHICTVTSSTSFQCLCPKGMKLTIKRFRIQFH